jgi:hypothetical protein
MIVRVCRALAFGMMAVVSGEGQLADIESAKFTQPPSLQWGFWYGL